MPAPAGPTERPAAPEPTPAVGTTTPAQDPESVPARRPALVPVGADDDHDGLTILSGDLATIRQNLPSWAVSQSGQWPTAQDSEQVPLVPLPTGAVPFAEPAPVPAEQPRVMLSTGSSVPVDGLVLIGRSPQPDRVPEGVRFRMVMVPSPNQDISRTHAEVRVEDGRTLVTDLFSTNGVTVTSGDLSPRRITAGEPVAVQPGDVVDLGDGVTFTVEPGA